MKKKKALNADCMVTAKGWKKKGEKKKT